jgi:hypothetical protein
LHELSQAELRLTNLVTTEAVADVLPHDNNASVPMAELKPDPKPKATQDRFASSVVEGDAPPQAAKPTKTAEAIAPTGGAATAPAPVK